jgi:2-polyprenyl-3-methyl-5-hydroxy-6-metoxy-1,4-benzoquinol methylase
MAEYKDYGFPDDKPSHTVDYLYGPLISMLDENENTCILDLGCGNGYLVNRLIAEGYNAYGTDASEEGIKIARKTHPDKFFIQDLSSDKLPVELQNLKFDTIVSTEVIEHLYDPQGFINFCKQALNNGGEIMISTPYHGYLKNLGLSIFNKWDTHISPIWYGGHIKFWSRATLSRVLTDAGFTVTGFKGCGRVPYFWKSMIIKAKIS